MLLQDDFAQAVEIIPGRFYFAYVKRQDSARTSPTAANSICYSIDDELVYEPFYADFGPLNLGKAYRFCRKTSHLLQEAERQRKRLYFYTGPQGQHKANAAVLVGIYQVLHMGRTADEAFQPLLAFKPYIPFRDPSCGPSTFHLTVYDCLKGVQKAKEVGFIDWQLESSTWSIEEYEHYEQVENGDLNWIVPNKLVAFSGPAARPDEFVGYRLMVPEDYWGYYRAKNVTAVIRLNKKVYDRKRFVDGGLRHYDMYFPDGSCPTEQIVLKFLETVENEPGAIAVHCKAGLGRTGVLICCYMMKHYRFTAEEAIGYIRVCRPGSVIGPQQNFLKEVEARMWYEGDVHKGPTNPISPASPKSSTVSGMQLQGRSAGQDADSAASIRGYAKGYSRDTGAGQQSDQILSQLQVKLASALNLNSSSAPTTPQYSAASNLRVRTSRTSNTPGRYSGSYSQPTTPAGNVSSVIASRSNSVTRGSNAASSSSKRSSSVINTRSNTGGSFDQMALRSTLHTDSVQNAHRPRVLPARNSQSADITGWKAGVSNDVSASWKITTNAGFSTSQMKDASGPPARSGGIARVLAPNGQPRKVPMSVLSSMQGSSMAAPVSSSNRAPSAGRAGTPGRRYGSVYTTSR